MNRYCKLSTKPERTQINRKEKYTAVKPVSLWKTEKAGYITVDATLIPPEGRGGKNGKDGKMGGRKKQKPLNVVRLLHFARKKVELLPKIVSLREEKKFSGNNSTSLISRHSIFSPGYKSYRFLVAQILSQVF